MKLHPCQDKCPNFTYSQCRHCLIPEIEQPESEGCAYLLEEIDAEYLSNISDEEKHLNAALISINEVS